jgi:hypothetical protein
MPEAPAIARWRDLGLHLGEVREPVRPLLRPKAFLLKVGIGRQAHDVAPYAEEGHRGPVVPICTHCHPVANERQRPYWFFRRVVLKSAVDDSGADDLLLEVKTEAVQTPR